MTTETLLLSHRETRLVVIGAMISLFLAALDQTIVATALPSISGDLGDVHLMSWIVTAYLLTSTAATPILGKMSDLHGRRPVMRGCIIIFLAGSVLCALSKSMLVLILARALQGFGGGGLITIAQTAVADVVAPRERGRYGAYFAGVWAGSALLGPILGGELTQYANWHWIFWINLPIGAIALIVVDPILKRLTGRKTAHQIDYVSIALFFCASTAFLLALSAGGSVMPWLSVDIVGTLIVSILAAYIFFRRQRNHPEPVIPLNFFRDGVVTPVLIAIFLVFGGYLALSIMTPTYLQLVQGAGPDEVGRLIIPLMLSTTVGAALSGRYISRTGRYKLPPLLGMPMAIACLVLLAYLAPTIGKPGLLILLTLIGFGLGPIFPIANVAAQNAVQRRDLGAVSGSISFARALGGAIATAAASNLVLGLAAHALAKDAGAGDLTGLMRAQLDPAERAAFAHAYAILFYVVAAWLALGCYAFFRVEARPLRSRADVEAAKAAAAEM
ncbi:MAG TPA: MDR family MFS transporter [Dongiaceae bacterium]|nr:MDR family MFS transporter [Dongiaceae bacterium]